MIKAARFFLYQIICLKMNHQEINIRMNVSNKTLQERNNSAFVL